MEILAGKCTPIEPYWVQNDGRNLITPPFFGVRGVLCTGRTFELSGVKRWNNEVKCYKMEVY